MHSVCARRHHGTCLTGILSLAMSCFAQTDPGPRRGPAAAGGPLPSLSASLTAAFNKGSAAFQEVEAVADGLGPRFNANSCAMCHSQPAVGGTSPAVNPLLQFANSQNIMPSFLTAN